MKNKLLLVSLLLFGLSLTQTAVYISGYKEAQSYSSLVMLLGGAVGILGGATLEWLVWLANPLYLFALLRLSRGKPRAALASSLAALAIAASFTLWREILVSESGRTAPISALAPGYYLWLASTAVLCIGAGYEVYRLAKTTPQHP